MLSHLTGYHRKYVVRRLSRRAATGPAAAAPAARHRRPAVIDALAAIWEAAGYPWSERLKALLPLWLPWARKRLRLTAALERQRRTMTYGVAPFLTRRSKQTGSSRHSRWCASARSH